MAKYIQFRHIHITWTYNLLWGTQIADLNIEQNYEPILKDSTSEWQLVHTVCKGLEVVEDLPANFHTVCFVHFHHWWALTRLHNDAHLTFDPGKFILIYTKSQFAFFGAQMTFYSIVL